MVKIRLRRIGAKKQPSYRLVVADSRAPRDGAFIAVLGHYNPLTDPETIVIDEEKALGWLKQGAQPTDTAARLLAKAGIIEEPADRKEKMKAGTPDKPKASKKKAKATAAEKAKAEEPKAEAAAEPKAEAAEEPKAEATEETKAEVAEEPKAEAAAEPEATTKEPKAEAAAAPKAEAAEEPEASEEPTAETSEEQS